LTPLLYCSPRSSRISYDASRTSMLGCRCEALWLLLALIMMSDRLPAPVH
jgi:hypothetical protein